MDAELYFFSIGILGRAIFAFNHSGHDFGSRRLAILLFRLCSAFDHRLTSVYGHDARHSGVVVEMRRFAANCADFFLP